MRRFFVYSNIELIKSNVNNEDSYNNIVGFKFDAFLHKSA